MPRRFVQHVALLVGHGAACIAAAAFAEVRPTTDAFDGTWSVTLVCDDTRDRDGLVKGYRFVFDVQVANGRLDGWQGDEGQPSSLHLTGTVHDGGALEIRAEGRSGASEYVVGRAARGTPYAYTMSGRLDGAGGDAVRREVRPCRASFAKRDPAAR